MITNFGTLEGLKYHTGKSNAYNKMIMTENLLIKAGTRVEYIAAIGAMRGVLEQLLKEVLSAIGVTDEMIIAVSPVGSKNHLIDMISAIQKYMLTEDSDEIDISNMHYIRRNGNEAVHGGNNLDPFAGKDIQQLENIAVSMYEYLYEIVERIDEQFCIQSNIIAQRKAAQRQSSPASQKAGKPADKRGWGTWFK